MKLSEIKPNPNNPRLIKDEKFKKLCQSIKDFPQMMELRPIVIDENNITLGGNMRLKALKELGYKEIPETWVKKASELSEVQKKEFIVKDNVGFGEWEWDVLANEWDSEQLNEWGLDVPNWNKESEIKEININPYKKTHVLISFNPELLVDIQEYLQKIKNIPGIEYEQASN